MPVALADVADPSTLAGFVSAMLQNPDQRRHLGQRAEASVRRHADLPDRTAEALLSSAAGSR